MKHHIIRNHLLASPGNRKSHSNQPVPVRLCTRQWADPSWCPSSVPAGKIPAELQSQAVSESYSEPRQPSSVHRQLPQHQPRGKGAIESRREYRTLLIFPPELPRTLTITKKDEHFKNPHNFIICMPRHVSFVFLFVATHCSEDKSCSSPCSWCF